MTLSDALVAALIGAVAAFALFQLRARREDRYRFGAFKRERYAEFLRLAAEHVEVLERHLAARKAADTRWREDPSTPPHIDEALPALGPTAPIARLGDEIVLLSTPAVYDAAREMYESLVYLDRWAYDSSKDWPGYHAAQEDDDLGAAGQRYSDTWEAFVKAAKADLGTGESWRLVRRG